MCDTGSFINPMAQTLVDGLVELLVLVLSSRSEDATIELMLSTQQASRTAYEKRFLSSPSFDAS
jgi:hypothetical protein